MRITVNAKRRIILAVVGVTALSLVAAFAISRRLTSQYSQKKAEQLFKELVTIEAEGYSTAFMESVSLIRTMVSRIQSELQVTQAQDIQPDLARLNSYIGSVLDSAGVTVRGYGVVLKPGVFPVPPEGDPVNVNSAGTICILYTRKGGVLRQVPPMKPEELDKRSWWHSAGEQGLVT